jgi:hypothetical protein
VTKEEGGGRGRQGRVSRLTPNCNFPVENFPPSNVHRPQQGESHPIEIFHRLGDMTAAQGRKRRGGRGERTS